MTKKALHRLGAVEAVAEGRLKQGQAAEQLGVTTRQVTPLVAAYRRDGASGLVSRRPCRPSNRRRKKAGARSPARPVPTAHAAGALRRADADRRLAARLVRGTQRTLSFPERVDTIVHTGKGSVHCICPQTGEQRDLALQDFEADRNALTFIRGLAQMQTRVGVALRHVNDGGIEQMRSLVQPIPGTG